MILVLMGVTGSGKTTVGELLAAETGWLRKSYRDLLLDQIPPVNILFILLEVSPQELAQRLAARKNHYMNPGLLQSQLDTLEITPDLMRVPADGPPQEIVQQILDKLLVVEGKTEI
jgi:gluconate kinase